jgi:hypothetical protein
VLHRDWGRCCWLYYYLWGLLMLLELLLEGIEQKDNLVHSEHCLGLLLLLWWLLLLLWWLLLLLWWLQLLQWWLWLLL